MLAILHSERRSPQGHSPHSALPTRRQHDGNQADSHILGKAEMFLQTLCREWTYAMAFQNSEERNRGQTW